MVADFLNLESLKMRDELKAEKEATEQAVKDAIEKTSLSNIETLKQFGITLTKEQEQTILEHALEQQEFNVKVKPKRAADLLNLESLKMRDEIEQLKKELEQQKREAEQQKREAEQQKREAEQQKREAEQQKQETERAAQQTSLPNDEVLKRFGLTLTEDQKQEMLKCAVEEQESEE